MRLFRLMLSLVLLAGSVAVADTLPAPEGRVVLTLSGLISHSQDGQRAMFDLVQLRELPSDTFELQTEWTDRPHVYKGPLLSAVLERVGAKGKTLYLRALNDYTVDLDVDFVHRYQPILAWQDDDRTMTVRNKGPLWLVLPLHRFPELTTPENSSRMIWQLSTIEVR
ncbi:hypothetical protein [Marinobacterium arenosum]|uniref:hypothetical protein n=1 Tax=Marinobacterium arenosum TaxID=2862496 RepID=UPI001C9869AB|nr:hypothetical protein [Marinobacterium arenosum]MBY4678045.1 hypothetical protein [Marinobacterium arenosum]